MNFQITIIAGIGFDKDGDAITAAQREMALEAVRQELADKVGGYTEMDSVGGWNGPDGALIQEAGKTWTLVYENASGAKAQAMASTLAGYVRRAFNQNSVLSSVVESHAFFVTEG